MIGSGKQIEKANAILERTVNYIKLCDLNDDDILIRKVCSIDDAWFIIRHEGLLREGIRSIENVLLLWENTIECINFVYTDKNSAEYYSSKRIRDSALAFLLKRKRACKNGNFSNEREEKIERAIKMVKNHDMNWFLENRKYLVNFGSVFELLRLEEGRITDKIQHY